MASEVHEIVPPNDGSTPTPSRLDAQDDYFSCLHPDFTETMETMETPKVSIETMERSISMVQWLVTKIVWSG